MSEELSYYNKKIFVNAANDEFNKDNRCIEIYKFESDTQPDVYEATIESLMFNISEENELACKEKYRTGRNLLMEGIHDFHILNPNVFIYNLVDSARIYIPGEYSYELSGLLLMRSGVSYYEGNGFLYIDSDNFTLDDLNLYLRLISYRRALCDIRIIELFASQDKFINIIKDKFELSDEQIDTLNRELPPVSCFSIIEEYKEFFGDMTVRGSIDLIATNSDYTGIFNSYNIIMVTLNKIILGDKSSGGFQYCNIFYKLFNDVPITLDDIADFTVYTRKFTAYSVNINNDKLFTKLLIDRIEMLYPETRTGGAITLQRTKSSITLHNHSKSLNNNSTRKINSINKALINIINNSKINIEHKRIDTIINRLRKEDKSVVDKVYNLLNEYVKSRDSIQKRLDDEEKYLEGKNIVYLTNPSSIKKQTQQQTINRKTQTMKKRHNNKRRTKKK